MIINRKGKVYSWGQNEQGQLGLADFESRKAPQRIKALQGRHVTQIGLGDDFAVAIGLTLDHQSD